MQPNHFTPHGQNFIAERRKRTARLDGVRAAEAYLEGRALKERQALVEMLYGVLGAFALSLGFVLLML